MRIDITLPVDGKVILRASVRVNKGARRMALPRVVNTNKKEMVKAVEDLALALRPDAGKGHLAAMGLTGVKGQQK